MESIPTLSYKPEASDIPAKQKHAHKPHRGSLSEVLLYVEIQLMVAKLERVDRGNVCVSEVNRARTVLL